MSHGQDRWRCEPCGANNMPQSAACFRCHTPRMVAAEPTLYDNRNAVAARKNRGIQAFAVACIVGALLILCLNNPSKEEFGVWAVQTALATMPDSNGNPFRQLFAPQVLGGMISSHTTTMNFGVGSLFDMKGYDGKTSILAIGVCRRFVPLKLPSGLSDPPPASTPDSLKPAFQPAATDALPSPPNPDMSPGVRQPRSTPDPFRPNLPPGGFQDAQPGASSHTGTYRF